MNRALRYLSYRPRTEFEVRTYLGEDCTEDIISRLKDYKFIDDAAYVRWYTEQRSRFAPRSQKLIALELKKRGISIHHEPITSNDSELAQHALRKKLRLWGKLPFFEFRVKASRFLASRGFSYSTIESVVKTAYNGQDVN